MSGGNRNDFYFSNWFNAFQRYLLDIIAYSTTSHGIWRFIPHQGDYIPRNEAVVNPMSYAWLLDNYFILTKVHSNQNKRINNLTMGYGN